MKHIYLTFVLALFGLTSFAQLPDGSTSPDFTLSDFQTGETFNLYSLLDDGKAVILDFSATWCPPCWNYHNTHILEDIYNEYGPVGSYDMQVFHMEADPNTNDACLVGNTTDCNSSTMGDWTIDTPYPIFNTEGPAIRNAFQIGYWPTIYIVAPNKQIFEGGQASIGTWESYVFTSFKLTETHVAQDALCVGTDGGSIDITTDLGFGTISYLWSNGATTQDLEDLEPGTYSCTITEGRGYRIETGPIVIDGPDQELTAVADAQDLLCNGDNGGVASVTAQGGTGTISYLWNTGSTEPTISNLSGGTYTVSVMDQNGCEKIEQVVIDEPEEISQLNQTMPATCSEQNGLIQIYGVGGTVPYEFSIGSQTNNSGYFNELPGGIYNASVVDFNGCAVNFIINLDEFEAPLAEAESLEMLDCINSTVQISGEGSSVGSNIFYTWSTIDGEIVDGESTLYPTVSGIGTYTLQVWDQSQSCLATADVTVEGTFDAPTADAGEAQVIDCTVLEVVLDGSNSDSGSNISYLWTTADGNILEGAETATPTVNAGGTYELQVLNSENGCSSISTVIVTQAANLPTADAGEIAFITCIASEVSLDGSGSSTDDGLQYTWTTEDGNIVMGENTLNPVVDAPGVYLLEVLNAATGCVAYSSVEVGANLDAPTGIVNDAPTLTCVLTSVDVLVTLDEGDFEINWSTDDGSIASGENTDVVVVDAPGTYVVTFTNLATGCVGSTSVTIEENLNTPVSAFTSQNDEQTVTFMDQSEGDPVTYLWNFGDGNTSTEANPVHVYVDNGDYEVCLTITNECGENTTCTTVTILAGSSLVYDQNGTDMTCNSTCDGTSIIVPADEIENYSIVVEGPNGFTSTDFDLIDLCSGTYTFTLTNEIGESIEGAFEIIEPAAIAVEESTITHVDCSGNANGEVVIELSGGTGEISVMWDDGTVGMVKTGVSGGEHTATVTDANGCSKLFTFTVDEPTALNLDDNFIVNVDDNTPTGSIDITVSGGTPEYSYLWSHGETTEDVTDLGVGEYKVFVTDANGCMAEYGPFDVQNLVAVYDIEELNAFSVQPNPTNGLVQLNIEFETYNQMEISVINNLGQTIYTTNEQGRSVTKSVDLTDFTSGLYFVKLAVDDAIVVKKLVKN